MHSDKNSETYNFRVIEDLGDHSDDDIFKFKKETHNQDSKRKISIYIKRGV